MAVEAPPASVLADRDAYVAEVLRRFEENPVNRDYALAMCLWALDRAVGLIEPLVPQVAPLVANPMLRKFLGG